MALSDILSRYQSRATPSTTRKATRDEGYDTSSSAVTQAEAEASFVQHPEQATR